MGLAMALRTMHQSLTGSEGSGRQLDEREPMPTTRLPGLEWRRVCVCVVFQESGVDHVGIRIVQPRAHAALAAHAVQPAARSTQQDDLLPYQCKRPAIPS